jgi:hypothetical protein
VLAEWARRVGAGHDQVPELAQNVSDAVGGRLEYAPGSTYVGVDVNDVFGAAKGVCQDFAHLALAALRVLGVPLVTSPGICRQTMPRRPGTRRGSEPTPGSRSPYRATGGGRSTRPTGNRSGSATSRSVTGATTTACRHYGETHAGPEESSLDVRVAV